jgi:hypothetical protein
MEQSTLAYLLAHQALKAIATGRYSEASALLTETLGALADLVTPAAPDQPDGPAHARPDRPAEDRTAMPARVAA